ncbi:MAG: hypothetical protein RLZZ299_1167 [Pseudomonadota bacterium]|jgi:hypothetical protein
MKLERSMTQAGRAASVVARPLAVGLLVSAFVPHASAGPGDHVRIGPSEWTPGVSSGVEYHSNVFLADGLLNEEEPGVAFRTVPSVKVALDSRAVAMAFEGSWFLRKYLDITPDNGLEATNLDRYRDAQARLELLALRQHRVSLRVDDRFQISSAPGQLESAVAGSDANISLLTNDLRAGISLRPGSALDVSGLFALGTNRYDVPEGLTSDGQANLNDRLTYGPQGDVTWKFLPRTAFVLRGGMHWLDWDQNMVRTLGASAGAGSFGTYLAKPDATKWWSSTGLRGNITDRLAITTEFGFGQMTYDEASVLDAAQGLGPDAVAEARSASAAYARDLDSVWDGVTADLKVAYAMGAIEDDRGQTVSVGYRKDFRDAFFSNYVVSHALNTRWDGDFGRVLGAHAAFDVRSDAYVGEITRDDLLLSAEVGGSVTVADWFALQGAAGWRQRACGDPTCEDGRFYGIQYDDVYAQCSLSVSY